MDNTSVSADAIPENRTSYSYEKKEIPEMVTIPDEPSKL
jgi:hypothetical protein